MKTAEVSIHLQNWFVLHFFLDVFFAIPLMAAPEFTLRVFGWQSIDPFSTRLVAAALFGIGIESYLGRKAGVESYIGMLNLKIIWSLAASVGLAISLLQGAQGRPLVGWILLIIFVSFNLIWVYWRQRLVRQTSEF